MSKRHNHADVIIAWANGAEIEIKNADGEWEPQVYTPTWENWREYRIKPEPKPDIRTRLWVDTVDGICLTFVFDGETKVFKTVEYNDE
jgi:hypothetical protein